jgi:hypothetical protein
MWWLLGCAFHTVRTGLVLPVDAGTVRLVTGDGATVTLQLDAESAPLRYLHDVVVSVDGVRVGRRLLVRDWHVIDAGDGSNGYVGRLRVQGLRVFIEDRNTGSVVILDDRNSGPLRAYDGKVVLVIGHVSGTNTVTPVVWRLLDEE